MQNFIHLLFNNLFFEHINILLLLGIAIFGGTIGGKLFQKIKIPQVVGYIIIGILLGETGIKLIKTDVLNQLKPINYFALGLISFVLGGELKLDIFKKRGKEFFYILFFEAFGAFFFVGLFFFIIASFFYSFQIAVVIAVLLGSISSATAAAGTTDVLWEYKSKGLMTSTLMGIIALDDILALLLFSICSSIASVLLGMHNSNIILSLLEPFYEIIGSILLGGISGILLGRILKKYTEEDKIFIFVIGFIIIILGISLLIKVDLLLTATIMGVAFVNAAPNKSKIVFSLINKFSGPIYILFFVFVGANIKILSISTILILFIVVFVIMRITGKTIGVKIASLIAKSPAKIRKYLPFALLSQSGVAIGLSIITQQRFPGNIGDTILLIVTTTTFIVQLIGPIFIKFAVHKSGEAGMNITEYDIKKKFLLKDLLQEGYPVIKENMNVNQVFSFFNQYDYSYYPVVNNDNNLIGVISFENIRNTLLSSELNNMILAIDIMSRAELIENEDENLYDTEVKMKKAGLDYIIVTHDNKTVKGVIDLNQIKHYAQKELLHIQKLAGAV